MNTKRNENKFRILLLSFIIAVAVWITIGIMEDPDVTASVSGLDVHYIGEDVLRSQGLVITDTSSTPNMSVVISGKRNDLINYSDGIYINVDVSEITDAGEYSLPGTINLPSTRLTVEKEKYGNVPVKVEHLIRKNIPIKIKQTGTSKDGFIKSETQQSTVSITGAESEINSVSYGYVEIVISKMTETNTIESAFLLMDESNNPLTKNDTIEADTDSIEIVNTKYERKTLPVKLKLDDSLVNDYYLDEAKTALEKTTVDVGVLPECSADAVYVNIDKTDAEVAEFSLITDIGMYIPESSSKIRVKPYIQKKTAQRMDVTVQALNLAEGLSAQFNPIVSGVLMYGPEGSAAADNLYAYIDLSGLGAGSYELPVVFESEILDVREPHYVSVTIQ